MKSLVKIAFADGHVREIATRGHSTRNKIIYLPKEEDARWATAVKPLLDEYLKSMKAKGLPGDEALKFCLDYLKAHQK